MTNLKLFFIDKFNLFVDKNDDSWNTVIKWSRDLKNEFRRNKKITFF